MLFTDLPAGCDGPAKSVMAAMPEPVRLAIEAWLSDPHDYASISVTALDDAIKAFALRRIADKVMPTAQSAADLSAALIGTAVHEWIEHHIATPITRLMGKDDSADWLSEHRLIVPLGLNDWTLGGTVDLYDVSGKTLYDYKCIPEFGLGKKKRDYSFQLNAYRLLLNELGFGLPERLCLVEFARDWSDPAKGGKSKHALPFQIEEIPIDPAVTTGMLKDLAIERLLARKAVMDSVTGKPWSQVKKLLPSLVRSLDCPDEHRRKWGVLPDGRCRRCCYCKARVICNQYCTTRGTTDDATPIASDPTEAAPGGADTDGT